MKRRIIIGYDGSPNSEDALTLGKELCEVLDATPLVAACILWPRYLLDPPELGLAVEEDTKPILDRAIKRLAPLRLQTCSLYDDSAAMALQQLAEDTEPLMVVVGSAHRGPLGRVFLGSTGLSLLTGSPATVAVAPRGYAEREGGHLLRIGVAVDGGEESSTALESATELAERLHATLTIVGVLTPTPVGYGTMAGAAMGDLVRSQRAHFAEVLEEAESRVPHKPPGYGATPRGTPGDKLAEVSESSTCSSSDPAVSGPFAGSCSGASSSPLTRTADCPLVITQGTSEPWAGHPRSEKKALSS